MQWGKSWRLQKPADRPPDGPADTPPAYPLAVTAQIQNAVRLVAIDDRARQTGVFVGQTLSDARALTPCLQCYEEDTVSQAALLEEIAGWCDRYTPLVAIESEAGLFLDITGCAHLFGGETMLANDLVRRLYLQGFAAQVAIADTAGAAWAFSRTENARTVIAPDTHQEQLAPLPLHTLRLDGETVEALSKVGLKTIGCIAALPRAPLASRFGPQVLRRLNQAEGFEAETISPRKHVAELSSERKFPDAIVLQDDIERTIGNLAGNLAPRLEARGLGMRRIELQLFRVDGALSALTVQASTPLRDPERIVTLFRERLAGLHDALDAGFGFDLIRLNAVETQSVSPLQTDLVDRRHRDADFNALVDKLGARLGTDRIRQFQFADTHIPERSFALAAVAETAGPPAQPHQAVHAKEGGAIAQGALAPAQDSPGIFDAPLTRPLMLFDRPERIDVIAEIPEGPPLRFRWRKVLYRVDKCEGPERIACEWWRDGRRAASRDYYRIEEAGGIRFWMFRHGLYGRETNAPVWYMHGVFA